MLLITLLLALIDIITRDQSQVKHLPKVVWVFLVVLLPLIGTILWFTVGREWNFSQASNVSFGDPRRSGGFAPPVQRAPSPRDSRTTEEQLADLDREIEFYRNQGKTDTGRSADS